MNPSQPYGGELKNLYVSHDSDQLQQAITQLPRLNLDPRQTCDLELLLNGAFSPLEGFMTEADYKRVVAEMRLEDNTLWPMPITLDVDSKKGFEVGTKLLLCDEYGKPLAILEVASIYKPNKKKEAQQVYGTTDKKHPGVYYLLTQTGRYYVGGKVRGVGKIERYDFQHLRLTPQQLRAWFGANQWQRVIGFQTRNPIHQAHFALIKNSAQKINGQVLIQPVVGTTKNDDIDYVTRVKCYLKLHQNYAADFTKVALLPLSMRMAGPREALWHMIIRKNYGCTHFIVGRDHAGPGKNQTGEPFYNEYEAQDLAQKYQSEIGIEVITSPRLVYSSKLKAYVAEDEVKSSEAKYISGSEMRSMFAQGKKIPHWFSFPEVIEELERSYNKNIKDGLTIFFTGLSGSGKSTLAKILYFRLLEMQDKNVTLFDGDVIRQNISKGLGFSKKDRNINIKRIGFVANQITKHRGIVICAAIAPYQESRNYNRRLIEKNGHYVEIYVNTPLEVCEERDVKGLYKKARLGIITNFTGISDPYEEPVNPELKINTAEITLQDNMKTIINYLIKRQLIHPR